MSTAVEDRAREAMMKLAMDYGLLTLETLIDVIRHSQIVVAHPAGPAESLPAGFDATDLAILDWIVAEGQRVGRGLVRM
ncbi:MAG: hypothetical protein WBD95_29690 [Xanthobacteraceae bacterium]